MADLKHNPQKLTIKDFLAREEPPEVRNLVGKFNGGAFMCCHTHVFAETGVWIEELVPVFQKLDAQLSVTNDRQVRLLSPQFA
jgi:hypothetical protein